MKKRRIPMYRLVTYIVLSIFILIFAVIMIFNSRIYSTLIEDQGGKNLRLLYENTDKELRGILERVQLATAFFSDNATKMEYYKDEDLTECLDFTLYLSKQIQKDIPQVSTIHYGDYKQRSGGYILGDDGTIKLGLQDESTDNKLVFYNGVTQDSEKIVTIEIRDFEEVTWYKSAVDNPEAHWTDIFATVDNGFEMNMDYVKPIFAGEEIVGVVGMGVKLKEINSFLAKAAGDGVIYICDSNNQVVANSTGKELVAFEGIDVPKAVIEKADRCSDQRIRESTQFIKKNKIQDGQAFRINIKGDGYFGMAERLSKPEELGFRVVTLIPESYIVGATTNNQRASLIIICLIFVLFSILTPLTLRKLFRPIVDISDRAMKVTEENFGILIEEPKTSIAETHTLIVALNKMIERIQLSFREIKAREESFRSLVENSDDFILNLTMSGRIMTVNESFTVFIGTDRESIIGSNIEEVLENAGDPGIWHEQWERLTNTLGKVSFSLETLNASHDRRLLNVQLLPQLDDSGRLTNVIGTFTDITELMDSRRKLEELLKNENERLEALIEQKTYELNETMRELMEREKMASLGSLVAGISHEINTPLGVAVTASSFLIDENKGMIRMINDGQLTRESLAAYLQNADESTRIIQNNLRRAAELIASFKSISVDQSTEKEERFNFYDYLQSILLMLRHEYKNTGHRIVIDCPGDFYIYSFPGAYSQIFTNLIMNSLIHGFKEENEGLISIKAGPQKGGTGKQKIIRIEYRDNGSGISKENLSHIFDPFFTTARGTGTKSGSGLGLNIVYNLVTSKLGGTIKCESEPGKGVLFVIEIPYV